MFSFQVLHLSASMHITVKYELHWGSLSRRRNIGTKGELTESRAPAGNGSNSDVVAQHISLSKKIHGVHINGLRTESLTWVL